MSVVVVTGSSRLIGSEVVAFSCEKGFDVVSADNNMRAYFSAGEASTARDRERLKRAYGKFSRHEPDIRDAGAVDALFVRYTVSQHRLSAG